MKKIFSRWGKKILYIASGVIGISILGITIAYKYSLNFKPGFYNYRSYMSNKNIEKISNVFEYKQFNEINEFNTALISNRAVAGIGSDFQAVSLIKKGKLGKINYSKLFNMPNLKEEDYEEALQTILRPEIWEHLNAYNEDLKTNEFGEKFNNPKYLWQYFMPYYSQDAVIAYNILKNPIKPENLLDTETGELNFEKYRRLNFDPNKMVNIMKILSENGFNNWVITDAMRDNLLYGSSYSLNLKTQERDDNQFTGKVFEDTFKTLVDNFTALIKDGTGFSVNDTNNINFKGDGLELLNDLINPNSKINAAIMYNGDAIDAYYSTDNFESVEDGSSIRIIRPIKNILLLDGLVISSAIEHESINLYSETTGNAFFKNSSLAYKFKLENPNLTIEQANSKAMDHYHLEFKSNELHREFKKLEIEFTLEQIKNYLSLLLLEIDKKRILAKIEEEIDRVNIDAKLIKEYYLEKVLNFPKDLPNRQISLENLKLLSKNNVEKVIIATVFNELLTNDNEFNENSIDQKKEKILSEISNKLAWILLSSEEKNVEWKDELFSEKYLNIENFDYINYTPSIALDYKFIEKNYFYNGDGTIDETILNIYRIDKGTDKNITHVNISPIGDSLFSVVNFYYYQKTKS